MKAKISLLIAFLFVAGAHSFAQQRFSVEERVKNVMDKIEKPLKLDKEQAEKTQAAFTKYYEAQTKMMEEMRASGQRPDRSVFEKLTTDRDEKLQGILTPDQYKKFKEELEETLRPQRRN